VNPETVVTVEPEQGRDSHENDRAKRRAIVVADAGWYTTADLFSAIPADRGSTLLLSCIDYRNAIRRGVPPWRFRRPLEQIGPSLRRLELVLPSGWMKSYPKIGMRPIARAVRAWREEHAADLELTLVVTYPHYLYLYQMLEVDRLIYLNIDDYSLYWPKHAKIIENLEREIVAKADLTVCVSRSRRELLRDRNPAFAERIEHHPHGLPAARAGFVSTDRPAELPLDLSQIPRPVLGFVGSLEDRLDWRLLDRLACELPHASIVLIGDRPRTDRIEERWIEDVRKLETRPNVRFLGRRANDQIARYIQAFDICLIPYRVDHPFNLACCPTKIIDYMGTGRPIVSTALPECLLYREYFDVADDADAFIAAARSILESGSDDGRGIARAEHARANTCEKVVERLLDRLKAIEEKSTDDRPRTESR
jgi:glycosyltransferase involved in cell wall biosynthesis